MCDLLWLLIFIAKTMNKYHKEQEEKRVWRKENKQNKKRKRECGPKDVVSVKNAYHSENIRSPWFQGIGAIPQVWPFLQEHGNIAPAQVGNLVI
jgi:hypothetical protein